MQSWTELAGSSESTDIPHCDAARHDTGVSSARRTSSTGSTLRGSDHSASNATRIESGTYAMVLIADTSDAVAADPIAVGAPAAYPAIEPSPIADRNPFMRPCCASADAINQSVPRANSSAGRSTGGALAATVERPEQSRLGESAHQAGECAGPLTHDAIRAVSAAAREHSPRGLPIDVVR